VARKYFGTDGIRGTANTPPMTADMALKVAMATAYVLRTRQDTKALDRVLIGKDTRLSGYMLEQAMAAGFVAMGMEVILTGPTHTKITALNCSARMVANYLMPLKPKLNPRLIWIKMFCFLRRI
jgi:phosphoglucosamine mutase